MEHFSSNVPSVICIVLAGGIALSGQSGWGWFLFLAFILYSDKR